MESKLCISEHELCAKHHHDEGPCLPCNTQPPVTAALPWLLLELAPGSTRSLCNSPVDLA